MIQVSPLWYLQRVCREIFIEFPNASKSIALEWIGFCYRCITMTSVVCTIETPYAEYWINHVAFRVIFTVFVGGSRNRSTERTFGITSALCCAIHLTSLGRYTCSRLIHTPCVTCAPYARRCLPSSKEYHTKRSLPASTGSSAWYELTMKCTKIERFSRFVDETTQSRKSPNELDDSFSNELRSVVACCYVISFLNRYLLFTKITCDCNQF